MHLEKHYNMYDLVGKRLVVKDAGSNIDLGLGTYLWDDEILLDSGKKITSDKCVCDIAQPSEVPPFTITLEEDTRIFEGVSHLLNTGYYLHKNEKIEIRKVQLMPWNHGRYVAGKFFYRGESYWLVMSEVKLPQAVPHLRLVT